MAFGIRLYDLGRYAEIKNLAASGRGMQKEAAPKSKSQFAEESAPTS